MALPTSALAFHYATRFRRFGYRQWAQILGGSVAPSLSASKLTRTSAVSAYPPTVDFTRPIDWQDGDKAVMQWSLDPTFATGVTEGAVQTMLTGTTTYNFGLSAIVSGNYLIRLLAWRGTRPTVPTSISNIVGVGDAVAPTITSATTTTGTQGFAGTFALTANKTVTWAIVGGADMAQFSISGSNLNWVAQAGSPTLTVQVQATSLFGVASTVQTITDTIAVNTANAFSFTPVTAATCSTVYTSNSITVAGIGIPPIAVSITGGQYSKNGGAYTSANGTATNGDTFTVQETSSGSYLTGASAVLTIGSTSGTYTVTTMADPNAKAAWSLTAGTQRTSTMAISGALNNTATGGASTTSAVRSDHPSQLASFSFEVTLNTIQAASSVHNLQIGVDNGATDFTTPSSGTIPGGASSAILNIYHDSTAQTGIYGDAYGIYQNPTVTNDPGTWQVNDVIIVSVVKSTKTVTFSYRRSGTTLQLGTPAVIGSAMTNWYAVVSMGGSDAVTCDFTNFGWP